MTMHERVKRMSPEELRQFVYWVYLCGNRDGRQYMEDSPVVSYFGGVMLNMDSTEVMPNDNVRDLWDNFEKVYDKM